MPYQTYFCLICQRLRTLKAKFFNAVATPAFDSNLLPPLARTVMEDVDCPLSMAATLTPPTSATAEKARRETSRLAVVPLAASIEKNRKDGGLEFF